MSAAQSVHQSAQRRAAPLIECEYQLDAARCVAALIALLQESPAERQDQPPDPPPSDSETADHRRPLGAGARPRTQDDRTSAGKHDGAVAMEDGRHEPTDV
jgi:hypothetical protein